VSKKVMTIFITKYFENIDNISGGYGERVLGLYGSYANNFSNTEHTIFFYTQRNNTILTFKNSKILKMKENVNPFSFIKIIGKEYKSYQKVRLILSWPYVSLGMVMIAFVCQFLYKCKIVLDVHDLPKEQSEAFSEKKNTFLLTTYLSFYTYISMKKADLSIMVSKNVVDYVEKEYKINRNKMNVIENGTFPTIIFPLEKIFHNERFTLTYCGSIVEGKGILPIITIVEHLKQKNIPVVFKIYGANVLGFIPNDILQIDTVQFSQINEVLNQADVLVIPYPKTLWFDITHPIKLSDYMAAGKPIVCLNLSTTGDIIRRYNCGIVCENYQKFEDALIDLFHNPRKKSMFGSNGSIAATRYLDWNILSQKMNDLMEAV